MKAVFVAAVALAAGAAAQSTSDPDECLRYCHLYSTECCEHPDGEPGLCELVTECTQFTFSPASDGLCPTEVQEKCDEWCGSGLVSAADGVLNCNNDSDP